MRQRLAVLAFASVVVADAGRAEAIPAFERRYQVECHFCHDIYPKLNLIGHPWAPISSAAIANSSQPSMADGLRVIRSSDTLRSGSREI